MSRIYTTKADRLLKFSPTEVKVALRLVEGESNKEIAEKLLIKEGTVKFHVTTILAIVGVESRLEFVVKYYKKDPSVIGRFPRSTSFASESERGIELGSLDLVAGATE